MSESHRGFEVIVVLAEDTSSVIMQPAILSQI
jgi:hypothetical protein